MSDVLMAGLAPKPPEAFTSYLSPGLTNPRRQVAIATRDLLMELGRLSADSSCLSPLPSDW